MNTPPAGMVYENELCVTLDVCLSHDGDLLAGAIESGGVKRSEIVDRRKVGGRQVVIACHTRGKLRTRGRLYSSQIRSRLHPEILQGPES